MLVMETKRHYHGDLDMAVYQVSLMHRFVCPLMLFFSSRRKEKIKRVNGIATLILVTMCRYVKFCTFFKNLLTVKFQHSLLNDNAYTVR